MSGAWAKGTTKAITTAPPPGSMSAAAVAPASSSLSAAAGGVAARGGGRGRQGPASSGTSTGTHHHGSGGGGGGSGRKDGRGGGGASAGSGTGSGGRGRGRGGGNGGGRHSHNNPHNNNNNNNNNNSNNNKGGRGGGHATNTPTSHRITIKDVELLEDTGMGNTPAQKAVLRINARELVRQRLQYVQPPSSFAPNPQCHWKDEKRIEIIQALCSKVMELGDVSKTPNNNNNNKANANNNTAPSLEECAPLVIDEQTRWKSKVMERKASTLSMVADSDQPQPSTLTDTPPTTAATTAEIVSQARLILNKISWTTLDKLTARFMEVTNLQNNEVVRQAIIKLLVEKAQMEPHFANMYAQICATIAKQVKTFKKELLAECQKEFEIDVDQKIANACRQGKPGTTSATSATTTSEAMDPEEMEYHSLIIRKAYIGHMKFLGELYLRDVVKLSIMMYCLDELLKDETHEDSLECFAHLMTTTGQKLDDHAKQNDKNFDWNKVIDLRQSTKISNRIKFLLQDLLDLRERGWVKRRNEETAKTIADIHKQVAKEEKEAKLASRRASQPNLRRASSQPAEVDEDGFVAIQRTSFTPKKTPISALTATSKLPSKPVAMSSLRRAVSQPVMPHGSGGIGAAGGESKTGEESLSASASLPHSSAKEGGGAAGGVITDMETWIKKIQSILKEYYISGDTDDAVLSVEELVQTSSAEGAEAGAMMERGAKVIEVATLFAMEGKPADVPKMLQVMARCVSEGKIPAASIVFGFADPLEFLGDIEIDAPLAGKHLAQIVSECLKLNALTLDFLVKESPENFRTSGLAAKFACQVLKQRGTDPSEEDWQVVESLMTPEETKQFESPKAMW